MEIENARPYFFGDIGEYEVKTTWLLTLSLLRMLTQFEFGMVDSGHRHVSL